MLTLTGNFYFLIKSLKLFFYSLYPHTIISKKFDLPIGRPQVLFGENNLRNIRFTAEGCFNDNKKIEGLIKLKILPDICNAKPFLPFRCRGKSYLANCKKCVETEQVSVCRHTEDQRALLDTYTIVEVVYAVQNLNYRIIEIVEILAFEETTNVFRKFLGFLAMQRISYSGFPSNVNTPEEKKKLLQNN